MDTQYTVSNKRYNSHHTRETFEQNLSRGVQDPSFLRSRSPNSRGGHSNSQSDVSDDRQRGTPYPRGTLTELKQSVSPTSPTDRPGQNSLQKVQNWIKNSEQAVPVVVVEAASSDGNDVTHDLRSHFTSSDGLHTSNADQDKQSEGGSIKDEDSTFSAGESNPTGATDQLLWDQFQMIPRDNVTTETSLWTLIQGIKLIAYGLLFCMVLGCAVVNKLSLLTMTSGIVKSLKQGGPSPTNTMLLIGLCFPYVCWLLTYSARSVFGNVGWPTFKMTISVLVLESLHSLGLCLLLFKILPEVDLFRALILISSILVVPSMCRAISSTVEQTTSRTKRCFISLANLLAFFIQLGSVVLCTVSGFTYSSAEKQSITDRVRDDDMGTVERESLTLWERISWEIPVALVLISIMTWENYIDGDISFCGRRLPITIWKKNLLLLRQRLYIFVSIWKVGMSILLALILSDDFHFTLIFSQETPSYTNATTNQQSDDLHFQQYGPFYAHLVTSVLCSYLGGLACKMCMQRFSFSLPLTLVTPTCAAVVMLQCEFNFILFPGDTYTWVCPSQEDPWLKYHLILLGLVWLSQVIVTEHVWFPDSSRMAKIERLFVTPVRCSALTDQFLLLRRRRDDRDRMLLSNWDADSLLDEDPFKSDSAVPLIYACATMWHETVEEMTLLLKSIFRIDIDHSARFLAQKYYGIKDPDYYEFEAHIFFDDAMELTDDDKMVPNTFVVDLMSCVDDAISSVHERQITLGPPIRTPTPYGGRLTWNLPGGTQLTVHMKDKAKIRHKKRWSQVMYMYYLLGFRILAQNDNSSPEDVLGDKKTGQPVEKAQLTATQLRRRRRCAHFTRSVIFNNVSEDVQTKAENTFILALDGDVDFRPDAVRLLVDRMTKNKKVGAACGRIHPTGSGPMIWYQMFEYAIGHWLQKSTEHVFGCVLCAPGCFTLFRGSSLMDDNMTRTYAKRATQAGHYVQYDQGEDRWLSTLLIQQGHRIDYCAAADAFTHAPETFSEFFNQRRRWGPSTLANIIDLLSTWKSAVKINDNLSSPYVFYQVALLVSTILGPATVLLMMAGAYSVVFKTSILQSHVISLIPAVLYILVCLYTKSHTQLLVGAFLSAVYSIVMTIVVVGTVRTAIDGTITSPNVVFLIMLSFIFLISAVLHPEEFGCVLPGLLYFICIPASYLVLNIYFLCNLNVVSWGTREAPKKKTKEDVEREKIEQEEKKNKKQKHGVLGWLGLKNIIGELGELFRQMRTVIHDSFKMNDESQKKKTDQLLEELILEIRKDRLDSRSFQQSIDTSSSSSESVHDSDGSEEHAASLSITPAPQEAVPESVNGIPSWLKKEDPKNPGWLSSPDIGDGPLVYLDDNENIFWKQLIRKYLRPIADDKEHKDKMSAALKSLRDNVVFAFFMVTALWIAFFLQLEILQDELKDYLFIKIPRLNSNEEPLTFQPFGLAFFAFFAILIIFQFLGMLLHRWGTALHLLSITNITFGQTFTEQDKVKDIIMKVAELQKMRDIEHEPEPDYDEPMPDYEGENDMNRSYPESVPDRPPPSYHTQDIPVPFPQARTNGTMRQIFNHQGQPTGRTLQSAFEKRYRNEVVRGRGPTSPYSPHSVLQVPEYPEPDYANY
ncbi:chitin synthase chs-2-like [Haliotis cracherodii]|uniref:chitin synthase chs-2-like n=1 Tax=Haliotis cracherodii TaxID=6455 RepID=UPI0039ED182E